MSHLGHVDDHRSDDDAGIVYHAACGDWHWRCYLCEPIVRSPHLPDKNTAGLSFLDHINEVHEGST